VTRDFWQKIFWLVKKSRSEKKVIPCISVLQNMLHNKNGSLNIGFARHFGFMRKKHTQHIGFDKKIGW